MFLPRTPCVVCDKRADGHTGDFEGNRILCCLECYESGKLLEWLRVGVKGKGKNWGWHACDCKGKDKEA